MPTAKSRAATARSPPRVGSRDAAGTQGSSTSSAEVAVTGGAAGGRAGRATTAGATSPTTARAARVAPGAATPAAAPVVAASHGTSDSTSGATSGTTSGTTSDTTSGTTSGAPSKSTSSATTATSAAKSASTPAANATSGATTGATSSTNADTNATSAAGGSSTTAAARGTGAGTGGARDRTLSPGRTGAGRGKKSTSQARSPPGTSSGTREGSRTQRATTARSIRSTRSTATTDPLRNNVGSRRQEQETPRRNRRRSTMTGGQGQAGNTATSPGSTANTQQGSQTTDNAATATTTTAAATSTSGTAAATSGSTNRRSSEARPHSGAPPTYEEAANHLTLEYGGYFVPYESRPIATPLTPSLSFSQMNLAASAAAGRNRVSSVSSVGGSSTYVGGGRRAVADQLSPRRLSRGRHSRRVGDLAVTASDRIVMTPAVIRDLEGGGEEEEEEGSDKCTRLLLPPMHICMATTCLVCNCVLPGSGTLVAAFGLFCCTKPTEWSCGRKLASSCLCILVALAQLILTPVLLIGWIWSILWGFAYVGVSHQEYHGIKDDEDDEDELVTVATGRGRLRMGELDDDDPTPPWALGYHRFDHPGSAPSQRRMSFVAPGATGSAADEVLDRRRQASMLRATRSYGYVEVHGANGLYGATDHYNSHHYHSRLAARGRLQRPPGSTGGSSSTLNNNRPMSQTTLTSYINDGMFLGNTSPPLPPRTHPPSLVTVDM